MTESVPAFRFLRFDRQPQKLGTMWKVEKSGRRLTCELWTHPLGWELRVLVGNELRNSEVAKGESAVLDLSTRWRELAEAQGWSQ